METNELLIKLVDFIDDMFQWDDFLHEMREQGYSEAEINVVIEKCKR